MSSEQIICYEDEGRILEYARIEEIATGLEFSEGPLWHPDGFLVFSDTPANKIYRIVPGEPRQVYLEQSGFSGNDSSMLSDQVGSNGLAFDVDGSLLICQHGNHAIAKVDDEKKPGMLVGTYQGKQFNSPNDIVVGPDGAIYFTDPPYGLKDQVLNPERFQETAGVYRYEAGQITCIASDLAYPNGICFSPTEDFMFVGSNHPEEPVIWKYHVADGEIKNQEILITQNADGIKCDMRGNLWMATDEGVLVVSPEGKKLALIRLSETPTNLNWMGQDYSELFVTARSLVYHIKNIR